MDKKAGFVLFHSLACPAGENNQADGEGFACRWRTHPFMIIEMAENDKIYDGHVSSEMKQLSAKTVKLIPS
jgi:hypothetical protein